MFFSRYATYLAIFVSKSGSRLQAMVGGVALTIQLFGIERLNNTGVRGPAST